MSNIRINKPVQINMEIVEFDSYMPSFKMLIKIELTHPTGHFFYDVNDIWFECTRWDDFLLTLNRVNIADDTKALLTNMSDFFVIEIYSIDGVLNFSLKIEEINTNQGKCNLIYQSIIDEDMLGYLKAKFSSFEKWW